MGAVNVQVELRVQSQEWGRQDHCLLCCTDNWAVASGLSQPRTGLASECDCGAGQCGWWGEGGGLLVTIWNTLSSHCSFFLDKQSQKSKSLSIQQNGEEETPDRTITCQWKSFLLF